MNPSVTVVIDSITETIDAAGRTKDFAINLSINGHSLTIEQARDLRDRLTIFALDPIAGGWVDSLNEASVEAWAGGPDAER